MKPMLAADAVDPRGLADLRSARTWLSTAIAGAGFQHVRGWERDVADIVAKRILIVALFTLMAVRIGADFLETGRLTGLLLLASEALVVVLTVFRRAPAVVDRSCARAC